MRSSPAVTEDWGLGVPLASQQGGDREQKGETWTDSSSRVGFRRGHLWRVGQASWPLLLRRFLGSSYCNPFSSFQEKAACPNPSALWATFSSTKLLQECYEVCRTWGACLAPPRWRGYDCVVNDPETFPAREPPPAFQTPMALSPLT